MSDLILISYYWVNSATHFYIRPQNINNESMLKTELDPISLQISTLAFIFLCFFLSCYPHFHLFSFFIMFLFFFYSFFPVTFLPVTFFPPHCYFFSCYIFSCYFFSGAKLLYFFLFLYLHPDCYLFSCYFFPVTFFPSTWYNTPNHKSHNAPVWYATMHH